MSLMEKSGQEVRRERCVADLRELCKGDGVDDTNPDDRPEFRKVFDYFDFEPADFPRFIQLWQKSIPEDNVFVQAFTNALFAHDGLNLTERRGDFLEEHPDISARTLMRYEIEGANIFVRHLEMAEDTLRREKEFQQSEDAARDADMEALKRRVSELEQMVVILMGTLTVQFEYFEKRLAGEEVEENSILDDWATRNDFDTMELVQKLFIRQKEALGDFPLFEGL